MAQVKGRTLDVEIAYAEPNRQIVRALKVPEGCTLLEAIQRSGLLAEVCNIDLAKNKVGIFGRLARLDDVVRQHDRIEIYRPLLADPKQLRRNRAIKNKKNS